MSTYLNPLALETPNGFKAQGALGGFLAGMNQDLANQMVGQSMQENNLDMQSKQQALDQARAIQQDKIDEADAIAAKARSDAGYYNSGNYDAMRSSNDQARMAKNSADTTVSQVEQLQAPAQLWRQMAAEMKEVAPEGLDPMNPQHIAWWQDWRQKMAPFAPNMPQMFDQSTAGTVAKQGIAADAFLKSKAAGATVAKQDKLDVINAQQGPATERAHYTADKAYDARTEAAALVAASREHVQSLKNEQFKTAQRTEALLASSVDAINKQPGGVMDGDVQHNLAMAEAWAEAHATTQLKDNTMYKLLSISSKPEDQQAAEDMKKQLMMTDLKSVKGYMTAKMGNPTGTPNPAATAATKASSVPTISNKAAYDNLKPGDHYIDARDGKTKVKS